jgi:hypothetical protein
MKRFAIVVAMVAMLGLLVSPVWASDRPSVDELIDNYYEIQGEAAPQAMWGYLYDLVTNAYDQGWGSIFVVTNNSVSTRIEIDGYVVPTGANPGGEIPIQIFLNPYEVRYINLSATGMGSTNAWAILWSIQRDFGSGVLLYCTNPSNPGIAWEKGWYFFNP